MDFEIFKLHHRGQDCLGVRLSRDDSRNAQVRSIQGIKWSQTNRCWYAGFSTELEDSLRLLFGEKTAAVGSGSGQEGEEKAAVGSGSRQDFGAAVGSSSRQDFGGDAADDLSLSSLKGGSREGLVEVNEELVPKDLFGTEMKLKKFSDWLHSRRHSPNTIKTYMDSMKSFLRFFPDKNTELINNDDIIRFNNEYILKNNYSASFQNQVVNAIKKFFEINQNKVIDISGIHRPKRAKPLPNVLSKEEIKILLGCLHNLKHQAMLSLTYSCGLRVGEMLSLVHTDIDAKRMIVMIRNAKGNKDRIVPLSPKILAMLRDYFSRYRPKIYLFEGTTPGHPYSNRSIQLVIKQAAMKAGIPKPVTMHWLRHSFATHLHESGTDIRYIQELLGHQSTKTTEIYTHISTRSIQNIKSPFDDL